MKIKLKVVKDYKGKRYYPNIEYVVDDETAKDILSKTKYAEKVEKSPVIEEESPVLTGNEEQKVDEIAENEQKVTKNSKKVAKNTEKSQ